MNRLKDAHALKLMPASSAANAEGTLRALLDAVIQRSSFPDESIVGVDFRMSPSSGSISGDGDDKATRECEADAVAMRQELAVLFRAIARLAPHPALGAVRGALARALEGVGGGDEPVRWQTVETALGALHLVGEGAHDGAVKPGGGGIAVGRVGGDAPGGVGRPGFQVARGGGAQARRARVARDLRQVPPGGGAATGAAASTGAGGVFGRQRGGAPFARGEPTRVLPLLQVRQTPRGGRF